MKMSKRFAAGVLTAAMSVSFLALPMSVFAEELGGTTPAADAPAATTSTGSIKVDKAADGDNTYQAYQILKGIVEEGDKMRNVDFGDNLPTTTGTDGKKHLAADLVTALKTLDSTLSDDPTPTEFATFINGQGTDARDFAKVIGKYVTGTPTEVSTTEKSVPGGYYIVKEEGNGSPRTLNLLKVAGAASLEVKEDKPTADKSVEDVNDSTGAKESDRKTADYDIGDDIPYTLTFKLPANYDDYEKYPVTFWDDMCAGLSLNENSVMIQYGSGTPQQIEFEDGSEDRATENGGTVYKYEIADLKVLDNEPVLAAGDTITITYTAKLTGDAVVIGGEGNPNTYTVEYASDPNWTSTPGPDEPTPPTNPPTEDTPPVKNVVFTYKLVVNKVDDDGNDLNGATFTLYKWTDTANAANADVNAATGWESVEAITLADAAEFNFNGLDDGIYKLEETKAPDDYNGIDPIMFEVKATHTETVPYSFTLEVDNDLFTVEKEDGVATGEITIDVENHKGIILPSTGGIGTVMFYVVGTLMTTGAATLLVVNNKKKEEDK